jgi:hypothetical protein
MLFVPYFSGIFQPHPLWAGPMAMAASHLSSGLCLHSSGNGPMEGLNKLSAPRSCQKCVTNHGWGSKLSQLSQLSHYIPIFIPNIYPHDIGELTQSTN